MEDNTDYTIETLKETFLGHAKMQDAHHEQVVEEFKKNFADQPLPDTLKNTFNISKALASICKEISELKEIIVK